MGAFLMYSGLATIFLGVVSLLRPLRCLAIPRRTHAAAAVGAGAVLVAAAVTLPAPVRRARTRRSLLDEHLAAWQFAERHAMRVYASADRTYEAVLAVTAREIRGFRLLTWIRAPRWPTRQRPPSILNPPADRPILDVALASGFYRLAEEPGREIVLGRVVVAPERTRLATAEEFAALERPGYAKAAINFRVAEIGGGWCLLTTETRIYATDRSARRRFGAYWRLIEPGSALIRRMWLRAIRRRAETTAGRTVS